MKVRVGIPGFVVRVGEMKKTTKEALVRLFLVVGVVVALVPGWASEVSGQENGEATEDTVSLPAFHLQRFRPAPGVGDYLTVFGSSVAPHLEWNAGVMMNYADDPLQLGTLETPGRRTIANQTQMDLMGSIGLFDLLELGVVLPWTVLQRSVELQPLVPSGTDPSTVPFRRTALNDVRVTAKFQLLSLMDSPVGLAFLVGGSLPVGMSNALASDGGFGAETSVVAEYVILQTIRVAANLGFRYRPGQRIIRAAVIGNELTWGLGGHAPFLTERLDVIAELTGAVGVQPRPAHLRGVNAGEVPVELLGGVRFKMHEDWTLTGGAGAGLSNGYGTPDWRVFFGVTGQWVTGGWWWVDYRQPGFRAEVDPCDERSQARGRRLRFEPADCPEPEVEERDIQERASILEDPPTRVPRQPREPREPEYELPEQDEGPASLRQGAIIITEQVNFATGSADILPESYDVLDAVVRILRRQDDIRLMRVEGHTDSVGNANANLRLSQSRSEAVREYLIRHGIAPERVEAIGYGEERPVADNSTAEGRAENRRVEFNILEMGDSR